MKKYLVIWCTTFLGLQMSSGIERMQVDLDETQAVELHSKLEATNIRVEIVDGDVAIEIVIKVSDDVYVSKFLRNIDGVLQEVSEYETRSKTVSIYDGNGDGVPDFKKTRDREIDAVTIEHYTFKVSEEAGGDTEPVQ